MYPYLETNVDSLAMSFSAEPIPSQRSQLSIAKHGPDTPFRSHAVIRGYVVDQSALHGLLHKVRDIGLPLVSVVRLEADQPSQPTSRPSSRKARP